RRNDEPERASRPFDVDRDGFVFGEGAGAMVLEREDHARARGARPIAVLAGGALTADAHHITAPDPEGRGAARAMCRAIELGGLYRDDVDYVRAHATATSSGAVAEGDENTQAFVARAEQAAISPA